MIIKTMTEEEYCEKCSYYCEYYKNRCSLLVNARTNGWITETAQSFDVKAKTEEPEMEYLCEYVETTNKISGMPNYLTLSEIEDYIRMLGRRRVNRLDWTGRPRKLK